MALNAEAVERLARLGYTTEAQLKYWQWVWQQPESQLFFSDFLRQEEEAADEYRRWFPQLQEFATVCRRALPVSDINHFSAAERE